MSEYNTYMTMAPANPAVEAVKKTGGSVVFLLATITYTVMLLLTLIAAFAPTSSAYADLLYEMTGDYDVYYVASSLSAGTVVGTLIASIPTILGAIGLWMAFGACKTKKPRVSTGGFSMVSAVLIIRMVCMCILLALSVILLIVATIAINEAMEYANAWGAYGSYGADSAVGYGIAAIIIVFAILFLFLIMAIVYYAKAVGTVRTIKKAANGIVAGKKISMFVIVINFIFVGFGVINMLTSFIGGFSIIAFLSTLCEVTFYVLITIALIQIRGKLNRIAVENAMNNTMGGTGAYTNYNTGAYENYNTGSYNNFNTGSVPPVQPQYEQPQQQAPQYDQQTGGYQYQQPQAPQYGQQTGGYQYQQPQGQQYGQPQQQAPQQNPWNNNQQ